MDKKKKLSSEGRRNIFQFIWALITNSFAFGFAQGKIYTGKLKTLCLPGLNCYSCPGAVASCPIGSLQAVISSRNFKFSFYVVGFMVFIGAIFGRFVCGWLCPFGLLQDLLHKIPFPKKIKTFKGDKLLRNLKYVILLVFVIILPMFLLDDYGMGTPWFCKYICPLGAIYSFFNKVAIFGIKVDYTKCTNCQKCTKDCKMNPKAVNSTECIRCGQCISHLPQPIQLDAEVDVFLTAVHFR